MNNSYFPFVIICNNDTIITVLWPEGRSLVIPDVRGIFLIQHPYFLLFLQFEKRILVCTLQSWPRLTCDSGVQITEATGKHWRLLEQNNVTRRRKEEKLPKLTLTFFLLYEKYYQFPSCVFFFFSCYMNSIMNILCVSKICKPFSACKCGLKF